jgi:hypothetical protein
MRIVAVEEPGAEIVSDPDGTACTTSPQRRRRAAPKSEMHHTEVDQ